MESWVGGKVTLRLEGEARGRVLTLAELENPDFAGHILRFYQPAMLDQLERERQRDPARRVRPTEDFAGDDDEAQTTEDDDDEDTETY